MSVDSAAASPNTPLATCPQAKRDTRNPTALSSERHLGAMRTTAAATYSPPPKVSPPQHGIKRAQFT